jgi:hypothetical protein
MLPYISRNVRLRRALTVHQGGVATGVAASSGSIIMHRKMAVTFAAVLLLGSTSAGFAQGTGRGAPGGGGAGSPGIGAAPGIGTGGGAGTPGIGTAPGIGTGRGAGTPGVGTGGSTNPSDTLPGMPSGSQSGNQSGDQSGGKSGNKLGTAPRHVPTLGETTDAGIKSEYLEAIPYKPCPANVRFPNGQQACLGLPYGRYAPNE